MNSIRHPSPELTAERRETVIRMTRMGYTSEQIGDVLGISGRSVQRHRVAAGIAKTPPPRLTDEELTTARNLLEDGAPYGEVARTLKRDCFTIRKHFPGMGWTRGGTEGHIIRQANQKLKTL